MQEYDAVVFLPTERYLLCVPARPLTSPVIEPSVTHRMVNVFIDSSARGKKSPFQFA